MNKNNNFTGYIGFVVLIVLAIVVDTITNGWALFLLWGWFAVPIFGLPSISIIEAIGIALVIGFFSKQAPSSTKEGQTPAELFGSYLGTALLHPFLIVVLGWFISGMM